MTSFARWIGGTVACLGLGVLALGVAGCGGDDAPAVADALPRPDAGIADAMPIFADGFYVTFTTTPPHVHRNDVVTFAFSVSLEEPELGRARAVRNTITGLVLEAEYEHLTSDLLVEIPMGEPLPGFYEGRKAVTADGDFHVNLGFMQGGTEITRVFGLHVEHHDE